MGGWPRAGCSPRSRARAETTSRPRAASCCSGDRLVAPGPDQTRLTLNRVSDGVPFDDSLVGRELLVAHRWTAHVDALRRGDRARGARRAGAARLQRHALVL